LRKRFKPFTTLLYGLLFYENCLLNFALKRPLSILDVKRENFDIVNWLINILKISSYEK
jgi:hypothetical protein